MSDGADLENDESKLVNVIIWFLFVIAILSVCARIGTRYFTTRALGREDWLVIAAQVTLLGQCVFISTAASQGFGKAWNTLPESSISAALKAEYVSTPLFLLTLALIKWSLSIFIRSLTPWDRRRLDLGVSLTVGIWALTSIAISLFQCALPAPWQYIGNQRCIDRRAWWTYVAILNIATEVMTVILYAMIFSRLHTSWVKKAILLSVFSTRLLVAAAVAIQLALFRRDYPTSEGTTSALNPTMLNQAVLVLSVVTACVPYLRPFMESLEADMVRVEE